MVLAQPFFHLRTSRFWRLVLRSVYNTKTLGQENGAIGSLAKMTKQGGLYSFVSDGVKNFDRRISMLTA